MTWWKPPKPKRDPAARTKAQPMPEKRSLMAASFIEEELRRAENAEPLLVYRRNR